MKVIATVENPEKIQITLTLTLSIEQWETIREALNVKGFWPCGKFRDLIGTAIRKVSAQVHVHESELTE